MYGFALRFGLDDVDIGTSGTNLKTDMFSIVLMPLFHLIIKLLLMQILVSAL